MAKQIDIQVSAEALRDARTKEGNPTNFQNIISALLDDGYVVAEGEGNNQMTFTDFADFGQWFNGTAERFPLEYPYQVSDDLDSRHQTKIDTSLT